MVNIEMEPAKLPLFRLPDAAGAPHGTLDTWQRKEMVLVRLHAPGCEACDALHAALRRLWPGGPGGERALYVVSPAPRPGALVDAEGRISRELWDATGKSAGSALVAVSDRFGDVQVTLDVHGAPAEAKAKEIEGWLDFVELGCGECFVPLDWA